MSRRRAHRDRKRRRQRWAARNGLLGAAARARGSGKTLLGLLTAWEKSERAASDAIQRFLRNPR